MPYPFNEPRWEFSAGDRTSLANIALNASAGFDVAVTNVLIDTHYIFQIIDVGRVQRGNFDAVATAINALTPIFNSTPPLPDFR
jgi:hypothetical protein